MPALYSALSMTAVSHVVAAQRTERAALKGKYAPMPSSEKQAFNPWRLCVAPMMDRQRKL
jgi:hypothetical protein